MAIDINIPSQVKNFANLAAFPVTGAVKTIYIAEDTNKTYRWTGSAYVEISASAAAGITVGTTAITSGTVGRVIFEGTGNVVQESANLFWDNTNARLGVGTSTPATSLEVNGTALITSGLGAISTTAINVTGTGGTLFSVRGFGDALIASSLFLGAYNGTNFISSGGLGITSNQGTGNQFVRFTHNNSNNAFRILSNSNIELNPVAGNVLIGTTTDAGFKLDVNGTSRFTGQVNYNSSIVLNSNNIWLGVSGGNVLLRTIQTNNLQLLNNNAGALVYLNANGTVQIGASNAINWATFSATGHTIYGTTNTNFFANGNVGINQATDAGFKLDVNGTARIAGLTTIANDNNINFVSATNPNAFVGIGFLSSGLTERATFKINWGSGEIRIGNTTGGGYFPTFYADAAERMRILGNGNVLINTTTDIASSQLTVQSTTKGFLPPRMTTTQKNAIATPAAGLMVYDTTLNVITYYNGTTWI